MYVSSITATFAAAHFLRNYGGRCESLHGHNWKVEVQAECSELDDAGMGLDFTLLRRETAKVLSTLDHTVLNELPPFREENPSSENIARYVFAELDRTVTDERVAVRKVRVWESDSSWAEYRPSRG
jgi:6-pyruvoyltetrahydropterin/6-carboxytetrahydropterin synthase